MIKVLHVISGFDHRSGGPLTALGGLAQAQAALGMTVSVAAAYYPDDKEVHQTASAWEKSGVSVRLIGPATGFLHGTPSMRKEIRELLAQTDVAHLHALWDEIQHSTAVEARREKKPYIFRPCGQLDPWCLNQSRLKKQVYMAWRLRHDLNGAASIHFTSATEALAKQALGLKAPAIVESNGVDLSEFETLPAPGSFRHRYPKIGNQKLLLFLSRIHRKKGLDLLIPAFAAAGVENVVLVIAGPDDEGYRKEIESAARTLGVHDRIIFTGMLRGPERIAALVDADLFVLPSYQENFGIAVVEALAAGTPVLITDQVQIHEEIGRAGVGGVTPAQVEPLTTELRRWLGDIALRERAAANARQFVWSTYNWQDIAKRWINHYGRLVS